MYDLPDYRAKTREVISKLENRLGEILNPGDERRILAETFLGIMESVEAKALANNKAQFVALSFGEALDKLGESFGVKRFPPQRARVNINFRFEIPTGGSSKIPKGTRATSDGILFFVTDKDTDVAFGIANLEIPFEAEMAGESYNNFLPDTILTLVDGCSYVLGINNPKSPNGGTDIEKDEELRKRIMLAPGGFSCAGSEAAYKFYALSADPSIADVDINSPLAGEIVVTVLPKAGEFSEALRKKVDAAVNSEKIRPLTDKVTVKAATAVPFTATATYFIAKYMAENEKEIKSQVEKAFSLYLKSQSASLGVNINPDDLRGRLLSAGAYSVDLTSPIFTLVARGEVATPTINSALTYGGLK